MACRLLTGLFVYAGEVDVGGAEAAKSLPQYGQNLSSSATSRLQFEQDGCKLHLQLGQKLKRALTDALHCGQG